MKNPSYDMEKINETTYQVRLDKGQSLTIATNEKDQTVLSISSGDYPRSVIDFFINYEFLVPLMVRKSDWISWITRGHSDNSVPKDLRQLSRIIVTSLFCMY